MTAPIVGPRTLDQLTGALRALEVTLGEKVLGQLNEICTHIMITNSRLMLV